MTNKIKSTMRVLFQFIFWIGLWQLISSVIDNSIILPKPLMVLTEAVNLIKSSNFWLRFANTLTNIFLGIVIGIVAGFILAVLAFRFDVFKWIFDPFISFIKTTPVVCLIIILLIWFKSHNLSKVLVSLVVTPNIYLNIISDLNQIDIRQKELIEVFDVSFKNAFSYLYFPTILRTIYNSLSFILGFSWKAGISAEVMSSAALTIGEAIYSSKIYLELATLFAYVFLLIILTMLIEKAILYILGKVYDEY